MAALGSRFRVVRLASEPLKQQTKRDDFAEWGAPALDQQQYQQKELRQRQTPFSQRGSIFWALVERTAHDQDQDGEEDDNDELTIEDGSSDASLLPTIYCHCESHRFDCLLRKADGTIVQGYSHHIGSVFTLPEHRKQGLASFFLTQIAAKMAKLPDAVGSVLYSDIGPTYYDRLGWRLYESRMASLSSTDSKNNETPATQEERGVSLYLDEALDEFLTKDKLKLRQEIATSAAYAGREVFVPIATRDSIEWQFCIGVYYASIRGFKELPTQCGLWFSEDAFITWCHNLKESTLYVARARFPETSPALCQAMLRAALREACKFQLKSVKIWDPPSCLAQDSVASRFQIEYEARDDSLSSAQIFAQHRALPSPDADAPLPIWLANEKFAWV